MNNKQITEIKFFIKFPTHFFVVLIICVLLDLSFGLWSILELIKALDEIKVFDILFPGVYMLIVMILLFSILRIQISNKYYCLINEEGIFIIFFNIYKKSLRWDSEIYYTITGSFFKLYDYKKMFPLKGKITVENNIEHGYISLKSKNALKMQIDNKKWICIPTKWLKNNIKINDIIDIINKFRNMEEKGT